MVDVYFGNMSGSLQPFYLSRAKGYLIGIPNADQGTISRDIDALARGDTSSVYTKQLRGPVRELISGHHRLIYFQIGPVLFFVSGFRKKSQKTPKREIEHAEAIYRKLSKPT